MKIMDLKGYNDGKSGTVCMEFGFMDPGNFVEKVWNVVYLCVVVILLFSNYYNFYIIASRHEGYRCSMCTDIWNLYWWRVNGLE